MDARAFGCWFMFARDVANLAYVTCNVCDITFFKTNAQILGFMWPSLHLFSKITVLKILCYGQRQNADSFFASECR